MRKGIVCGWIVALTMLLTLGSSAVSLANTITVTSLNDPSDEGFCTLHDAIVSANSANNIGVKTDARVAAATTSSILMCRVRLLWQLRCPLSLTP